MYYGNTKLVPIPQNSPKGKIVVARTTGYVYLQTGYHWNAEKRQPTYERKTIGKTDSEHPGFMYFSGDYEKYFGVVDVEVALLRRKYGSRELSVAGKFNFCMSFGPFAVIEGACKKAGCLEPLQRVFNKDWKLILGLCVHAIVEENETSQEFPGWCFSNYCGLDRIVADSEISRLYKSIYENQSDIQVFFELYWKSYSTIFPTGKRRAVGFDSTNQNYGGKGIPMAKTGHAKVDVGLPIINTAMIVDEETGIPLWYEIFDGSVLDKNQTPFSLKKVINAGFKKLFVVYDRGYYSEETIKAIKKLADIEFGILCPDGTNWVEALIREHGPEIKDKQLYYIPSERVYGNVYEVQPFLENGDPTVYYAYLFYDSDRANDERDTIHEITDYYIKKAEERKRYSEKMEKEFAAEGIIIQKTEKNPETGRNFVVLEDYEMIQALLDMKGFFVMISPTKMNPSEAIGIIRKRDVSEKGFASLMNHFNLRTTGRKKKETYIGMMFMSFIALICLSAFQYFEKSYLHAVTSRTKATVIDELLKYEMLWSHKDKAWEPAYAMNKDQKQICENVGLKEELLQQMISKVKMKESEKIPIYSS